MGVVSMIGKIVLVLANIILLIVSLAMIAIGIILIAGKDVFSSLVSDLEDELKSASTQLGTTVDTSELSLTELFAPVAYALIGLGVVIGAMSLLGCIGSCYTIKCVLILYVVVTSILFLIQLVIVILVYADKSTFDSTVKPYLKDTLDDYAGIEGSDAKTLAWNALMNFEDCCGVDDYKDFDDLDNWPATINGVSYPLITPVICCKTKSTDYTCATTPTDATNYWKTGCYDKLFDMILDHPIVVTVIAILLVCQFILIFFAIWILCTMNNKIDII